MDKHLCRQLPHDIIMKIIREAELGYGGSHWRQHRRKFYRVLTELHEIVEDYERIEPSLVWEINYENHCESCQEAALDRYLEYGIETK